MKFRTVNKIGSIVALALLSALSACTASVKYISGTRVVDTEDNRRLLIVVEEYRQAVERRDVDALVGLASKKYWEDGGTPTGADDFGYDGLKEALSTRFQRSDNIRYTLRYMALKRTANRAYVDVMIDASYTVQTGHGPQRMDMRDQNEMILEWDGRKWQFLSGM